MSLKKKDQDAIASLYLEGFDNYEGGHNNPEMSGDKHDYQDTWGDDLINSEEYQSVATITDALRRRRIEDSKIFAIIHSINSGDKNLISDALLEQGVRPRHVSKNAVFRDED